MSCEYDVTGDGALLSNEPHRLRAQPISTDSFTYLYIHDALLVRKHDKEMKQRRMKPGHCLGCLTFTNEQNENTTEFKSLPISLNVSVFLIY